MAEENSIIELTVPANDVADAVDRVCAEWGVARESVQVDVLEAPGDPGRAQVRITLVAPEADMDYDADPELDQARATLEALLERMHVRASVQASRGEPETEADAPVMLLDVQGDNLDGLIGRQGETVAALQYILRLILSKEFDHAIDVTVDVQGFKQRREEQLRRMARRMAEQAAERRRTMTLEPMPANERRLIHLELRDHPDVFTESVGEGTHRKVTIIPRQNPPAK